MTTNPIETVQKNVSAPVVAPVTKIITPINPITTKVVLPATNTINPIITSAPVVAPATKITTPITSTNTKVVIPITTTTVPVNTSKDITSSVPVVVPTTASKTQTTTTAIVTPTLTIGSFGKDVIALQQKLKSLGLLTGTIDGKFGKGTAGAVAKFQAVNHLTVTGRADSQVNALISTVGNDTNFILPGCSLVTPPSITVLSLQMVEKLMLQVNKSL